jgi:hypothetical protein
MPETPEAIRGLADTMITRFTPPSFVPGCEVKSIADIDEYTTNNGWIEAIVGGDNQQRVRYYGTPQGVAVNDFVDVEYFPAYKLYRVFGSTLGGTASVGGVRVNEVWEKDFGNVTVYTDNSGNVGINTTPDSSTKLHVMKNGFVPQRLERQTTTTNSALATFDLLLNGPAINMVDGFGPSFNFAIQDSAAVRNPIARISGIRDGADNSGQLNFDTASTGSITTKMTITDDGKVGIGTVSPGTELTISATVPRLLFVDETSANTGLSISADGSKLNIESRDDDGSFNAIRATIERSGNVGLNGVTSPSTALDIGAGAMEFAEMTAPAAGAANTTRTYAEDNAGTTRQRVKFSSGNAVTIAEDGGLQTYTPTNVVTDRSYDANSTSVAELADVLGTLIADFQAAGILG